MTMSSPTRSNKIRNKRGRWSEYEDQKLIQIIQKTGPRSWSKISAILGTRDGKQCRERWTNHLTMTINKTPFTVYEKLLVEKLYEKHGSKWSLMADMMPGRTASAIKNLWHTKNYKVRKEDSNKKCIYVLEDKQDSIMDDLPSKLGCKVVCVSTEELEVAISMVEMKSFDYEKQTKNCKERDVLNVLKRCKIDEENQNKM